MLGIYSLLLWLNIPINAIIILFGAMVSLLMLVFIRWNILNHRANPGLEDSIGQHGHGQALRQD
jgi:hypothetical protein